MAFDLATSRSLLLLMTRTVSQLRSWGSNDGSGGVLTAAAAAAAVARRGDGTGEGNGFGKVNKPIAKGGAAAETLLISPKPTCCTRLSFASTLSRPTCNGLALHLHCTCFGLHWTFAPFPQI